MATRTETTRETALRAVVLGLAVLTAVGSLLTTWTAIIGDPDALRAAALVAVGVVVVGVGCRLLKLTEPVVVLVQMAALVAAIVVPSRVRDPFALPALLMDGARHLAVSAAPVPPHFATTVLICLIVGVLTLLTDVLAIALDRPIAALVPLLTLLLVPALAPKVHTAPVQGLVLFAVGFVLILLVSQYRPSAGTWRAGAVAVAVTTVVTTLSLVIALATAPLVPVPPSARGTDGEPIQMSDVSLQLKREISQGADRPALEYTTDSGSGVYLRLYSLPTFSADGWHLTNSTVQVGPLSRPPGVGSADRRRTDITITGFRSEWLPAPYAPVSTTAGSAWGYLPDNLAILALGVQNRRLATAGLTYSVDSLDVRPTAAQVTAAGTRPPPDAPVTASVPSDVTPALVRLARQITADAPTAGAKAQAILQYLRRPEFTYSLDAQPGSGYQSLEEFLLKDKRGFCVQYAASMAILARIAGVPSRVAIGFTPGTKTDDRWVVTMHDMHSWPELYLDGYGWVAFEPTPGIGDGAGEASPGSTPSPTATPSATPSEAPATAEPSSAATPEPAPEATAASGTLAWVGVLAALALTAAALTAPRLVRGRQRSRRLATGRPPEQSALDAWTELQSLARDYGRSWPDGSPRFAAEQVATWVDAAADGVRELGLAAEQAQFGGPEHPPAARDWSPVASAFAADLRASGSRGRRLRAVWFPASLVR